MTESPDTLIDIDLDLDGLLDTPKEKATELMMQVHKDGKAAVVSGRRDACEHDVSRLHAHGLWATMQKDD